MRWLERSECKTLILNFEQFALATWEVMGKRAGGLGRYKAAVTLPVIFGICFYVWVKGIVPGHPPNPHTLPMSWITRY